MVRLWKTCCGSGSRVYRIDRNNDLVKNILQNAAELKPGIESLLRVLEETVPVQQIWLDMAEHAERSNEPLGGLTEKQVMDLVETTLSALVGSGRQPSNNDVDYICRMEGFAAYADIITAKYIGAKP
jgi:hypothetical protein